MLLFLIACSRNTEPKYTEVSDFFLLDVNPNSETYLTAISPARFRGKGTAWYFGHST